MVDFIFLDITNRFSGHVQRKLFRGEETLIVPVTMIVPGVLNGSEGALYYPQDEVAKSVLAWNGMPIPITHPQVSGRHVSARHPDVFEQFGVGTIYNAHVQDGKLKGLAYLSVASLQSKAPDILNRIVNGQKVELSTGLNLDLEKAPEGSEFQGKRFDFIARNYRPDHLAILVDEVGACSINDGCGVNVNSEQQLILNEKEIDMDKQKLVDAIVLNCDCYEDADKTGLLALSEPALNRIKEQIESDKASKTEIGTLKEQVKTLNTKLENVPVAKPVEKKEEPTTNKETPAEINEQQLPESVRNQLKELDRMREKERQTVLAEVINRFPEDQRDAKLELLKEKSTDALNEIKLLIPEPPKQEVQNHQQSRYVPAGGRPHGKQKNEPEEAPLSIMTVNYDEDDDE